MFKFFKEDPKTTAELKLQQIQELLFPKLELHEDPGGNKYHVDYSADSNLDAALIDLEDGHNDRVTQKTIRTVSDRLLEVRRLLEAYHEIDADAKYFVVDDMSPDIEEKVRAPDDV